MLSFALARADIVRTECQRGTQSSLSKVQAPGPPSNRPRCVFLSNFIDDRRRTPIASRPLYPNI